MPRRVFDNFSGGMITDSVKKTDSLYKLHDAYIRREGEAVSRGPILAHCTTGLNGWHAGWTTASFHPNFGVGAIRAYGSNATEDTPTEADGFQLMGAGLQADANTDDPAHQFPHLYFTYISEDGPGTSKDRICLNSAGDAWQAVEECSQCVNTGNEIVFAGIQGSVYKWGGSILGPRSTGTVSVGTAASAIIVGSGTGWSTTVEAGQFILINGIAEGANGHERAFRITNVHSDTEIEIEDAVFLATGNTGLTYRIQSAAVVQSPSGVWNRTTERPTSAGVIGYHNQRLVLMGTADSDTDYNDVFNFDKLRFGGTVDEQSTNFHGGLDLWHNAASLYVFPGHGGAGRGLVSMGNDLIVIKAHGMFRVTGVLPSYAGLGTQPSVASIPGAENVGAKGLKAWGMSKLGVVVASSDGLYLYDGSQCQSVTDGRISSWWQEYFSGSEMQVHVFEDKVIVTPVPAYVGYSPNTIAATSLVWDLDRDLFWTMDSEMVLGPCFTTFTVRDELVGQYCLPASQGVFVGTEAASTDSLLYMSHLNGQGGHFPSIADTYKTLAGVSGVSVTPRVSIVTHPIPLNADIPMNEGRANTILVHCMNNDGVGQTVNVAHSSGALSPDDVTASLTTLEYGIPAGTIDRVHRIPVESIESSPAVRIHLYKTDTTDLHIFAIGLDYEVSNVTGPA